MLVAHKSNVLLVPNASLRFNPKAPANPAQRGIGIQIGRPNNAGSQTADFGRGATRQVWVLGPKNQPQAINVTVGDTDGTSTEVSGPGVQPGMKVITGQLTAAVAGK